MRDIFFHKQKMGFEKTIFFDFTKTNYIITQFLISFLEYKKLKEFDGTERKRSFITLHQCEVRIFKIFEIKRNFLFLLTLKGRLIPRILLLRQANNYSMGGAS